MTFYQYSQSELEDNGDVVKVSVLTALVREGLLDLKVADEWASSHCVKISKKTIWRTLTNRWEKALESNGLYFTVVGFKPSPLESEGKP